MTTDNTTIDANDPLNQSCDDIDISYPLLPASNYEMVIKTAIVEPNKAQTGNNLVIQWATVNEQQSTKGQQIAPGAIVLKAYTGLVETPKYSKVMIGQAITRIVKGTKLGAGIKPSDVINNPSQLVGKRAIVKVGLAKETDEFPERNEIKGLVIEA